MGFLNCSVLSRYISKRSLLGGGDHHHHHQQPSGVYLPPPTQGVNENVAETTTAAPVAAVKPAETYLVEEEATVPDVVETEAPVVQSEEPVVETEAPVVKPSETYIVDTVTEIPVVETETPLIVTEAPVIKPVDTYIVENEEVVVVTEAPVVKPAETYIVETEAPVAETEASEVDLSTEARLGEPIGDTESEVSAVEPAETYFVDEETTSQGETVVPVVVFEAIEPAVINNSLDSAAGKAEHANGYWIEVSGDRDVLVQYHA